MDPNECLRVIGHATRFSLVSLQACRDLHEWLSNGGFAPDWDAHPRGKKRYIRWAAGGHRGQYGSK